MSSVYERTRSVAKLVENANDAGLRIKKKRNPRQARTIQSGQDEEREQHRRCKFSSPVRERFFVSFDGSFA